MFGFVQQLPLSFLSSSFIALIVGEVVVCILVIVLWIRSRRLKQQLAIFFSGKEAKDLEKILVDQLNEIRELDREIQELFEISNKLRELGMKSIHKTGVLRFNPFKEVGGNQSFCIALLDGKNSGLVITALHTREGTRVYAKPVVAGLAHNFPLTDEERAAI